jgi:hypothetical protein
MINLVTNLTAGLNSIQQSALAYLQGIAGANNCGLFTTAADVAEQHCNDLIYTLDGSASNLYIGASQTNSSIQTHFDGHYDVSDKTNTNPINATPYSRGIYDSQHTVGPSLGLTPQSPIRGNDTTGDWVETSSVSRIGWVVIDKSKWNI